MSRNSTPCPRTDTHTQDSTSDPYEPYTCEPEPPEEEYSSSEDESEGEMNEDLGLCFDEIGYEVRQHTRR